MRAVIEAGDEIGVTAIHVVPDSMRLAIEEELTALNKGKATGALPWNLKAISRPNRKVATKTS